MGYRSEVKIYIRETEDVKEKIGTLEEISDFIKKSTYVDECVIGTNSEDDRVLKIGIESTKWYSQYPEIKRIENLLKSLDEEDYIFARLGEELGDFELYGEYSDGELYVYAKIDDDFIDFK